MKLAENLKKAVLQAAMQGKLTRQLKTDSSVDDLLQKIAEEKAALIKEGKIKKDTTKAGASGRALAEITEEEIPFEIPENWRWVKVGNVLSIARGGSPRPITSYLTTSDDGYNWIKIGDTDDSMYITCTEEKIKSSGLRKTRQVHAGDLLLSNSMSFGRPYILAIDGCIHDGWLVLHFDQNKIHPVYLCSYLSQATTYCELSKLAAGGVVNNLNKEIVKVLPTLVPKIDIQKQFVNIVEQADKSKQIAFSRAS